MDYAARLRELGFDPQTNSPDCDIGSLEAAIGVRLPDQYRGFLLKCGGWWGGVSCPCREPTPFGDHVLSGFYDAGEVSGLLDSMITPMNMVTIGCGNFGSYTCLSIAGVDRGSVYSLDSEFRVYWSDDEFRQRFKAMAGCIEEYLRLRRDGSLPEKPAGYDSLYLVAEGFDEFLSLCRGYDDSD